MHPFRFGIINESFASPQVLRSNALQAEALGFDTFLIRDHLLPHYFGPQYAPLVSLAWLAAQTTTIHLGTLVLDNDFRHPTMLAKEIASLQALSDGRVELGIGAGWLKAEYDETGIPYDANGVRIDRLAESLAILRPLLAGECASVSGTHYQVDNHAVYPAPPAHQPVPFLIGAGKPRMLRLAGQYADIVGLLTVSVSTGEVMDDITARRTAAVRERIDLVRFGAGIRFNQIELQTVTEVVLAPTIREAAERCIHDHGWDGIDPEVVMDMPAIVLGPPEAIADQLQANRESLGLNYIVVNDADLPKLAPVVKALSGT
ncbi:MAG TPA: TIGR03621 family F420-dependent LLM class oxidoreductase [Thermomicrobiales bacterium]|nr:TIGR03621 family F420-dependent LLM class oxidoreductase [Thermomicrobiales bacterium]